MGKDKATLVWKNKTLLEDAISTLKKAGCTQVRISGEQDIVDNIKNIGPLGGIISCLHDLKKDTWILFWPVDVVADLKSVHLFFEKPPKEIQSIYTKNAPLPCLIKNTPEVRDALETYLKKNLFSVKGWLKQLTCYVLPAQVFQNLNTPEDYKKAKIL